MDIKVGDKFGDWTVINTDVLSRNKARYVQCQCKCGTETYKLPIELLYENRDFQCAQRERALQTTITNGRVGDLTLTEHTRLRRSAEKRGYAFEVSIEYLWNLFQEQKQICAITGDYIPNIKEASLDRIDSSKGYIEGNVQWVTYQANVSKHTMTMEQLYEFCRKVLNYANQQPNQPLTKLEGSETNS